MNDKTGKIILLLRQRIETKRKQMFDYASTYGINSSITIQCSQELDILLNRLNRKLYYKKPA
ncbi:MAG TPA: aspartyl-phosphate phosphatase Spo0E family protein [Bacillus bacterium]|nr:aspartyl-phosphate phosphatase Spo0E family protein [Bacillus sp. (in: firmicutes)]